MLQLLMKKRVNFYISIATLVVILVSVLTGVYLWNIHRESSAAAMKMADRLFEEITGRVVGRFHLLLGSVNVLADSGANMPDMIEEPVYDGLSHKSLEFMIRSVENFNYIFSVYSGYSSGNFLQVIAPRGNELILSKYEAPVDTRYIVRSITHDSDGIRKQYWRFLDLHRHVVGARTETYPEYDPRKRPWYLQGLGVDKSIFTDPYIFASSKEPGITCARHLLGRGGVFGVDITLFNFSHFLEEQEISEHGTLFLFDHKSRLIAHPGGNRAKTAGPGGESGSAKEVRLSNILESENPVIRTSAAFYKKVAGDVFGKTHTLPVDDRAYLVRMADTGEKFGINQILAVAAPMDDFTGYIKRMETRVFLFAVLVLALAIPMVIWASRKISRSLMLLADEANRIRNFDFSDPEPFDSVIKEIHVLIQAFSLMRVTIRQRTDALIATQKKLERLVEQGISLSAERDMNKLVELAFLTAKELSSADGGILYLVQEDGSLGFEIVRADSAGIDQGGTTGEAIPFKPVPLVDPKTGEENHGSAASRAALTGEPIMSSDMAGSDDFNFEVMGMLEEKTGYLPKSLITVPLKPRHGKSLGVLQLINPRDPDTGEAVPFHEESLGFVEAVAAQAAVALDNRNLLAAQRNLFDAFIQLLAGAIDAKSPYTGGHCARVPELAVMLAETASSAKEGPFSDFSLTTDDERQEFRIAAWLHDCGKVTTPEYVVDKATKLETIYNRIHEVRMRFEVLWRDAEIECYRALAQGSGSEADLGAELAAAQETLQEEFSFIAGCNIGGEYVDEGTMNRIKEIASQKWVRHFDDRLGISQDEQRQRQDVPVSELPAEEYLLADKPEHVIERESCDYTDHKAFGFNMEVPEALYNMGEVYNLSIQRGTLTDEERFKINEHIVQTIIMLEKLPFPEHLARVSEFAGAHHETMIGTGYPRHLTREQMSMPARAMAIADIFEALTASDRPYKKAKTIEEAIRIMSFMRDDKHIDPDLFDLFLEEGVYKQYGEKFLAPEQMGDVDVSQYLRG